MGEEEAGLGYPELVFTEVLFAASSSGAETSAELNPGCSSSTSRPRQGIPRLLLGKEEGVKCISRAWQEPANCCLPWMGSNKASSEVGWLEGTQWETSVTLPKALIC